MDQASNLHAWDGNDLNNFGLMLGLRTIPLTLEPTFLFNRESMYLDTYAAPISINFGPFTGKSGEFCLYPTFHLELNQHRT